MKQATVSPVARVALTRDEAAAALGVSVSHFDRHVKPHLRVIFSGGKVLVSVRELEAWAERASTLAGGGHGA